MMFTFDSFPAAGLSPALPLHDTVFLENATLDWFAVNLTATLPQPPAPASFFDSACRKQTPEQTALLDALFDEHFRWSDGFVNDDDQPLAAATTGVGVVPVAALVMDDIDDMALHLTSTGAVDHLDLFGYFPGAIREEVAAAPVLQPSPSSSFAAASASGSPSVASTPSSSRPPSPTAAGRKRKRAPDTRKRVRPTVQQRAAKAQAALAQLEADNARLRRELAAAQASITAVVPLVRELLARRH